MKKISKQVKEKQEKRLFNIYLGIFLICIGGALFIKILVPMVLSMLNIFLVLLKVYPTLEIQYRFFGGFIFLFILWKVFNLVGSLFVDFVELGIKKIRIKEDVKENK